MRNTWAVCKREFAAYFLTPIGYVVVGVFSLISGLAFTLSLLTYAKMSLDPAGFGYTSTPEFGETFLSPYLVFCGILFMFISPLMTMRLLAEERHKGTIELMLTWPLRDREIIFGKYLAALGMLLIMMLIIAAHLVIVSQFRVLEPVALAVGVLTVVLMGMSFLSMGLFVSAVTRNQITAGTITFGANLLFYVVGNLGEKLPETSPAPEAWPDLLQRAVAAAYGLFRNLMMELPLDAHAKDLALGVVTPKDIGYYLIFSAFFLFLTFRALESRHWRGK